MKRECRPSSGTSHSPLLAGAGVKRPEAALITYLANINEANSREIEIATSMRQPEASTAMRTLRQNNWATEREIKAAGKGRPMKVYKLNVPLESIINHYEEESKKESAQAMMSIQRLREFTTTA
jgi:predicted transcriptional regulator